MNSKLLLTGLIFATLAVGCATQDRYPKAPTLEEQFKRADKNGDGKVSRAEFGGLLIDDMVVYFDKNNDAIVTKEEFLALGGTEKTFNRLDKNGNGSLTAAEVKSDKQAIETLTVAFVGADVNKDGFVTLEEAKAYRAKAQEYTRG